MKNIIKAGLVFLTIVISGVSLKGMELPDINALYIAIQKNDVEAIGKLVTAGANLKEKGLLVLATQEDSREVMKKLLDSGADVNEADNNGYTPLHWAAAADNLEAVKMLLARGADPLKKENTGMTALELTTADNVEELLKKHMPLHPNVESFFTAINTRNIEKIKELVAAGVDPNVKDKRGLTGLMIAALKYNNEPMITTLIDLGADVNATNDKGETALHYAASTDVSAVFVLLSKGADPTKKSNDGELPSDSAMDGNIITMLESARIGKEKKGSSEKENPLQTKLIALKQSLEKLKQQTTKLAENLGLLKQALENAAK